jgi:hypothetical protein
VLAQRVDVVDFERDAVLVLRPGLELVAQPDVDSLSAEVVDLVRCAGCDDPLDVVGDLLLQALLLRCAGEHQPVRRPGGEHRGAG